MRLALASSRDIIAAMAFTMLVAATNAADFNTDVKPLLDKYCFQCHGETKQKGKLRLDNLSTDFLDQQAAEKWIEVMDNLNLSEMPPEDEDDIPMPTTEERSVMARWVAAELRQALRTAHSTGGRALLRRMSRTEYENTVKDLLGVVFEPRQKPMDLLPPDGSLEGFDKVSKALLLDPSLMEMYLDVGRIIADRAVRLGDPPVPTIRKRLEYEWYDDPVNRQAGGSLPRSKTIVKDGVITWDQGFRSFAQMLHPYNRKLIPIPGKYAVRFRAGADPGNSGKPVLVQVKRSGDGELFYGPIDAPIDQPKVYEIVREFGVSGGEININMVEKTGVGTVNRYQTDLAKQKDELIKAGKIREAGKLQARMKAEGLYGQGRQNEKTYYSDGFAKLFVDYIEIEGPLYPDWPPASTKLLFFDGTEKQSPEYLREIFTRLLPRAYRRPVTDTDINPIITVAEGEWEATGSFEAGVKAGLIATLCSPDFLYVVEPSADKPRPLNSYETASRLSYFLWSTMPDKALFDLAAADKLTDPKVVDAQITRMLASPKAEAMVQGFAKQWLKTSLFDQFEPDRNAYKMFYEPGYKGINEDLNEEPVAFFREIMRNNGDLRDFLDSDWTMANARLAKYYGFPKGLVKGEDLVKVKLPGDSHRGGLLGMGAVHKMGSDGNRTKPVQRGVYVLEVLFNDPPDPPPPNAGELEPNVKGENLTIRERLEQHRQIESCGACHRGIDPYGLALENFNVIGQWRDRQDGENRHWGGDRAPALKPAGKLPNGQEFAEFADFKALLRAQDERFLRGFSEKLFVYALGRGVEPVDREIIDGMVAALKTEPTVSTAVRTLVASKAFGRK